ncbi:MAG: hypothetical protein GY841_00120 [FCB group bacterium]|nr:hypothetical protein [FCB group bacterium]
MANYTDITGWIRIFDDEYDIVEDIVKKFSDKNELEKIFEPVVEHDDEYGDFYYIVAGDEKYYMGKDGINYRSALNYQKGWIFHGHPNTIINCYLMFGATVKSTRPKTSVL